MRLLADISTKYLRAYYNERFQDFDANGEAFALNVFADFVGRQPITVWDVGANTGGWASVAASVLQEATIHSFEIVPAIADAFEAELGGRPRHFLHRFGLSETPGTVDVTHNLKSHTTSSIAYRDTEEFGTKMTIVECEVQTIDLAIESGISAPTLLKIDTEGHDFAVLRGANTLLAGPDAPLMIQFEYGETWLPPCETLEKCHKYLVDHGYALGRLYPNHVEFKDYSYEDDHYRMGNMIATRNEEFIRRLGGV
ncbi:MAG: FkbM family methyltransferase [Pseudomonadota bacterium]